MKIGVIHPGNEWILSIIARRLCAADPEHFYDWTWESLQKSDPKAVHSMDGWLYWDIQNCWNLGLKKSLPQAIHVGAFTHLDKDSADSFRVDWDQCDGVIHMAQRYYDRFVEQGWYRPEQMAVIRPGEVADMPIKRIRIGVCQRGEHIGKGAKYLPAVIQALDQETKVALELHFCGKGWITSFTACGRGDYYGVSAINYPEESFLLIPYEIDYLLVPSLWEGGCMAVLESLAAGIPIISSDVGWMSEFNLEYIYSSGNIKQLVFILQNLAKERLERRHKVDKMSYKNYAYNVMAFFQFLRDNKNA